MSFSTSRRLAAIMAWRSDWISESVMLSSGAGSSAGALYRALASVWDFPGLHEAWKLYPIRRWRRGVSVSPRWCLLGIVMSGLWSVMISNWLKPPRKMRHFFTAQATASLSSSIMAYLVSISVRNRDPACIRCHLPLAYFCLRTNPRPRSLLASVRRAVGQPGSKQASVGVTLRACLVASKAWSWLASHINWFFVFRRGQEVPWLLRLSQCSKKVDWLVW